eukprot:2943025-Amphidinium_carterae.1
MSNTHRHWCYYDCSIKRSLQSHTNQTTMTSRSTSSYSNYRREHRHLRDQGSDASTQQHGYTSYVQYLRLQLCNTWFGHYYQEQTTTQR